MANVRLSRKTFNGTTATALLLTSIGTQASGLPAAFEPAPADSVLTAQASFNNLRYTLIDLDPNDNITPSITFTTAGIFQNSTESGSLPPGSLSAPNPTATLSTFEINANHPEFHRVDTKINEGVSVTTSDLLPASDLSIITDSGQSAVAIGSNYLANGSRLTDTEVAPLKVYVPPEPGLEDLAVETPLWQLTSGTRAEVGGVGTSHIIRQVNTIVDDSDPDNIVWSYKRVYEGSYPSPIDGRHRFELSPNTKVIFEGTASTAIARQLSNASFLDASVDIQASVSASAGMSVQLYDLPEGHATEWPDYTGYEQDLKLQYATSSLGANYGRLFWPFSLRPAPVLPLDLSRSQTEDLSVSFSNDGNAVAIGAISLFSATGTSLFALTSAVPETSSTLMMSLGLLALGAAASRRRQSSMPNS